MNQLSSSTFICSVNCRNGFESRRKLCPPVDSATDVIGSVFNSTVLRCYYSYSSSSRGRGRIGQVREGVAPFDDLPEKSSG